jgi:hypothetical protein
MIQKKKHLAEMTVATGKNRTGKSSCENCLDDMREKGVNLQKY